MDENVKETRNKTAARKAIPFIIAAGTLAVLAAVFIFIMSFDPSYTHFSKKRIKKVEERFCITVTDDLHLVRYDELKLMTQMDYSLKISNIPDYRRFMENNVDGRIIEVTENHTVPDLVKKTQKPDAFPCASYKYVETEGNIVEVDFYDMVEGYTAILHLNKNI